MGAENQLLDAIIPSLGGVKSDILTTCGALIALTIIVTAFFFLRDLLFVGSRKSDPADDAEDAYYNQNNPYLSQFERDKAKAKYKRLVREGAKT